MFPFGKWFETLEILGTIKYVTYIKTRRIRYFDSLGSLRSIRRCQIYILRVGKRTLIILLSFYRDVSFFYVHAFLIYIPKFIEIELNNNFSHAFYNDLFFLSVNICMYSQKDSDFYM